MMESKCAPLGKPLTGGRRHPLEKSEASYADKEINLRKNVIQSTFGSYLSASLEIEKTMFSKIQRLPPMRSSNLSYELVTGEDHSVDRCHLHNPESMALAVDGHKVMEKRLKM